MVRAVIDTSSLYASSLRRELQRAAVYGLFTGIWSPWIIAELNRVLVWRWINQYRPGDISAASEKRCSVAAKRMMELLLPTFELVAPVPPSPPAWPTLTDVHDEPIWAAAVLGNAQYVISENTRHYPPQQIDGQHAHEGIEYVPARTFLDTLIGA